MDLQSLDYPRAVHRYHPHGPAADGAWLVVADAAACQQALTEGWSLECVLEPPDDQPIPEPVEIPPKRKPGRPRKEPL